MTATRTPPGAAATTTPALTFGACGTIGDLLMAQPNKARISEAVALAVLADAGIEPDTPVTDEQRNRAEAVEQTKAGLVGKARAQWIVTGDSGPAKPGNGRSKRNTRAAGTDGATRGPREGSTMHSVLIILNEARSKKDGPLSSDEIFERMKTKKLAGNLKGKTPVATINAQLCTALKNRQHGIARPDRGKWEVAK